MRDYALFTPGPVRMHPDVVQALARPIIPHYGAEWVETVYNRVLKDLHEVFQTDNDIVVLPSSGSGATESVFCSLASEKRTVAIFRNGFFGDRLLEIANHYFRNVIDCAAPYSESITPDLVHEFLGKHPDTEIVAIVHGETSTGVANDIEAISKVVKEKERIFMVDAVSTLGAIDVAVEKWDIDFCVSASQKGLSAPPGLSFVSVSEMGYAVMPPRKDIPGWYHNLRVWKEAVEEWGAWHPYPVTLPVNLFYALQVSLEQILDEGLEQRFRRHKKTAAYFRKRIRELGAKLFCAFPGCELDTVTSFILPEGLTSPELLAFLKSEYGMIIASGHGAHKDCVSRVGHMGYGAQIEMMDEVLGGIAGFFRKGQHP